MIQLRVFGGTDLRSSDGQEFRAVLAQPKRLALLVYLALATPRGPQRRDRLIALFWPEHDTDRARNALSQAIFFLRRVLGPEAILNRNGEEIELAGDQIWCDAIAFAAAVRSNRYADAIELYRGELLAGVHIPDTAPELERWLESMRHQYQESFAQAVEAMADEREKAGDHRGAVHWWRRLAGLDPYSARIAVRLMLALARSGDRAGAIQHARIYETLIVNELESQADPDVAALAQELQSGAAVKPAPRGEPSTPAANDDEEEPVPAVPPERPVSPRRFRWRLGPRTSIAVASALVAVLVAIFIVRLRSASAAPVIHSIAVLPFTGYSNDPRQDYLAQSMTDATITDLAVLPSLRVISRQSVLQFAGSTRSIPDIARILDVDAIVEGTFLRDGQHIRLNVQLIDARTDRHFWAKHYDRDAADLVSLEDELAGEIAREIRAVTTPDSLRARLSLHHFDPIVTGQYVRGEYLLLSRSPGNLHQAIDFFQAAVSRDTTFALGYAAIAEAYGLASDLGFFRQAEANDSVKAYVARALAIDSMVALAHVVRAGSLSEAGDFAGAEKEFQRAIALEPNNALAHGWHAMLLATLHKGDLALAEIEQAEQIDPLSASMRNIGGSIRAYFGASRKTGKERQPIVVDDPTHPFARAGYAVSEARNGRCDGAMKNIAKAVADVPNNVRMTLLEARVHMLCGDRARALALFDTAKHLPEARNHGFYIALGFRALGKPDSMFAWLDSTSWNVEQRFNFRTTVGLDSLNADPRYQRVLRRMGLGT
jgi:TolB-like protein/DNA-binding SARP family transcriptional activator/Tfp pilus assembly protein PilF